jgi:alkylresorcinol/alkylpyrone synthase
MGWDITATVSRGALGGIPHLVRREMRRDVDRFSNPWAHPRRHRGLRLPSRRTEILEAFRKFGPRGAPLLTWDTLKRVGNLSSASVLLVLDDTMKTKSPAPGAYGLLMAMGPGFCAELVLLQW